MSKLLPCPCCGGEAKSEDHRLCWFVRCQECGLGVMGVRVPELEDGDEERIDWQAVEESATIAWNRRTSPPGWQLVPIKPTPKMSSEYNMPPGLDSRDGTECWEMMLSAAPRFGDEP